MKRVITSLVLIPVVLYIVILGPTPVVFAAVAVAALLCYREYRGIAGGYGVTDLGPVGYAAGLGLLAVSSEDAGIYLTVVALLAIALAMRSAELTATLARASAMLLGVVYIFGSWKCAILLREIGPYWLLFALAINWVGDIAAYYVGKSIGKRKLAPRVSPGKTWEGSVGSLVASVAFGLAYWRLLGPVSSESVVVSALANVAGQFGDLAESALKRGANLKDSGSLLPGHGGLLDRVDSALFTMPALYLYLRLAQLK